MPLLRPGFSYDAPLFRFNEERPYLTEEVVRRVYGDYLGASRKAESARLEYVLNETAYQEIERLRVEQGPEEEIRDPGWWRRLAARLGDMSEDEKRAILRDLVESYVDDTAGKFDPRVFRFATGSLPLGLNLLFKTQDLGELRANVRQLRAGLRGLRDLAERVVVEGEVDTVRRLVQRGTVVVVPTHSSNMDSILMGWALHASGIPPVTYGAGKNLFTNPLTSFFMHNLGAYKVDRRLRHGLYKDVLKNYSQVLIERGYHSLFFPGGTRCRSNEVDHDLKLGLLGTALTAYTHNLERLGRDERIYICPVTINYNLVLEAESLIQEHLRREGGGRYFLENDEFNQVSTIVRFVLNTMQMSSTTVIRFGEPMDPFGNRVDTEGESYDSRGRRVDPRTYVQSARTGEVCQDTSRDRQYTRFCGERIAEAFRRETVLQPSSVVAFALYELLQERFPTLDVYRLLRLAGEETIPWHDIRAATAEVLGALRELARDGKVHLAGLVRSGTADAVIDDGVQSLTSYHTPAVVSLEPGGVRLNKLDLLYFYGNRVRTYRLDARELLARAAD